VAVCAYGHENQDAARFCTTCGLPLAAPAPASPVPAPRSGWGPPPSDPIGWGPPASDPIGWGPPASVAGARMPARPGPDGVAAPPGSGGRRRRLVVVGIVVALVLALCAGGLVVMRSESVRDEHASTRPAIPIATDEMFRDLVVVTTGPEGEGLLHLAHEGEPIEGVPAFGRGEVVPIRRPPSREDSSPIGGVKPDPGLVAVPGGAVVAWRSSGAVTVAAVRVGDPRPRVLFKGSEETAVSVDDQTRTVPRVLVEDRGACSVSEDGLPAWVVAYGPGSCRFQRTGEIITGRRSGAGEVFTLRDADGSPITEIEPKGTLAELRGSVVAVIDSGSVAIADAETGRLLHEYEQEPMIGAGTTPADGGLLVGTGDSSDRTAASRGIDLVTGSGQVQSVAEGLTVNARIGPDGTVVAGQGDWKRRELAAVSRGGGRRPLVSAPGLEFEVVPGDQGSTVVVAWDRTGRVWFGPATDALPLVGTIDGLTGLTGITAVQDRPEVVAWTDDLQMVRIDADGVVVFPGSWEQVEVVDASPRGILVVATRVDRRRGVERDLVLLQGESAKTLDEGDLEDPRFDGDGVIYQWRSPKAPQRDTQIRRVVADGRSKPEVIQRGASIALPQNRHWVWRVGDTSRWRSVTGCGALPTVDPGSSATGLLDGPTTACVVGFGQPGAVDLEVSTLSAARVVIENEQGVVAAIDGPLHQHDITFRTDGTPTMVRLVPGSGEAMPWMLSVAFKPGP